VLELFTGGIVPLLAPDMLSWHLQGLVYFVCILVPHQSLKIQLPRPTRWEMHAAEIDPTCTIYAYVMNQQMEIGKILNQLVLFNNDTLFCFSG
jgi:hypothetical protein